MRPAKTPSGSVVSWFHSSCLRACRFRGRMSGEASRAGSAGARGRGPGATDDQRALPSFRLWTAVSLRCLTRARGRKAVPTGSQRCRGHAPGGSMGFIIFVRVPPSPRRPPPLVMMDASPGSTDTPNYRPTHRPTDQPTARPLSTSRPDSTTDRAFIRRRPPERTHRSARWIRPSNRPASIEEISLSSRSLLRHGPGDVARGGGQSWEDGHARAPRAPRRKQEGGRVNGWRRQGGRRNKWRGNGRGTEAGALPLRRRGATVEARCPRSPERDPEERRPDAPGSREMRHGRFDRSTHARRSLPLAEAARSPSQPRRTF